MPITILFSCLAGVALFINFQEFLLVKFDTLRALSFVDELIALTAYAFIPFLLKSKDGRWVFLLLLLPIFSIFHGLLIDLFVWNTGRVYEIIIQSLINFKLFLYFVIFYCLYEHSAEKSQIFTRTFSLVLIFSVIGVIYNLLAPSHFVYSTYEYALERQRIIGFQFKPNDLAILLSFAVCLGAIFYYERLRANIIVFHYASLFIFIALILASTSRTALLILLITASVVIFTLKNKSTLLLISLFIGIFAATFSSELSNSFIVNETLKNIFEFNNIQQSQYIRFIMIYYSIIIAFTYVFGVGASNFGSVMSSDSPAYLEFNLSTISFFQNMEGIYDSNFASILGEYGFFGLFLYLVMFYKILRYITGFNNKYFFILFLIVIVLTFLQPFFNYHVNSINFLLLGFAYKELTFYSTNIERKRL